YLLPDGSQVLLFRPPIACCCEAVTRLNMNIVFGAVQFAAGRGNPRTQPGFVWCLILAESGIAVNPENAFRHGNIHRNVMVPLSETINQSGCNILHVLPSKFILITVFLEPLPVVVNFNCLKKAKRAGMYIGFHITM